MSRRPEQTLFIRRYTNGQQGTQKMLNIMNHEGNAKKNHNEVTPHTCQNWLLSKYTCSKCWPECGEKRMII